MMAMLTGKALLCFLEDGSHFQGILISEKQEQFGLSGKPIIPPEGSYHECCFDDIPNFFSIKIIKHSTNEIVVIKHVMKTGGDNCSLQNEQFDFHTDELLVGSKADTAITQYFDPGLKGRQCYVCVGNISITLGPNQSTGYVLDDDGF